VNCQQCYTFTEEP